MRWLIWFLIALPLTVAAQAPEPTLRSTTSEVLLDLVVRDKHANIIRDLKPGEIQVFEDGVPQKLRHFEFVDGRTVVQEPAQQAAAPSPAFANATAPQSTAPAAQHTVNELRDISVVSVIIANLDPRGRKLTMDAMRDFVKNQMRPNTYVGVFSLGLGGFRVLQTYTNDGEKISAAVARAANSALIGQLTAIGQAGGGDTSIGAADSSGPPSGYSDPPALTGAAAALDEFTQAQMVQERHDVYQDSMHFLVPLHELMQAQAAIPGRKVVLLFAAGLPVSGSTVELLRAVIGVANRSNVTVYAVDPRGIRTREDLAESRLLLQSAAQASMRQQLGQVNGGNQMVLPGAVISQELVEDSIHANTKGNLTELADGTGGMLLPASLDLREPLRRVMEDVRTHYELTYAPINTAMDGTFRKIEVKVSRPGAKVFARSGYYALPLLNGRQIYPFEIATMKALNTRPDLRQFDFSAAALQYRPGKVRNQMAFVFQAPTRDLTITKDAQWAHVHVAVTALVKNDKGQVVDKISKDIPYKVPVEKTADLERGIVSFTAPFFLPPGHYTVDTAAIDRQSMKASVSRSILDVLPDDARLSMSDVAVARRVDAIQGPANGYDPLEARGATITPELSHTVLPDGGGKVQIYAVGYPPAPVDAPIAARVEIWRDGQLVVRSPASAVPPDASGAAPILVSLPTDKFPLGRYEAEVTFQYKNDTVTKKTTFTLAAGSLPAQRSGAPGAAAMR